MTEESNGEGKAGVSIGYFHDSVVMNGMSILQDTDRLIGSILATVEWRGPNTMIKLAFTEEGEIATWRGSFSFSPPELRKLMLLLQSVLRGVEVLQSRAGGDMP